MFGTNKMFWVDIIEDCILRSKKKVITLKNFSNNFADIEIADGQKKIIAINKVKSFAKSLRVNKKNILIENLIEATNIQPSSKEAKGSVVKPKTTKGGQRLRIQREKLDLIFCLEFL